MHWYAGASCRLYPAAEADTAAEATVAGEEAETAEPETAENADESEGEEIQELQSTKGWTKLWDLKMFFRFTSWWNIVIWPDFMWDPAIVCLNTWS